MFTLKIETDNAAFSDDGAESSKEHWSSPDGCSPDCPACAEESEMNDATAAAECARILRKVMAKLEQGQTSGACMDLNGNKVGEFELVHDG